MAQEDRIVKIYDLTVLGGQDSLKELDAINKKFIEIKKNKVNLTATKGGLADTKEIDEAKKKLDELKVKEKELAIQMKELQIIQKENQLLAAQEKQAKIEAAKNNVALAGTYDDIAAKYKELLKLSKSTTILNDPAAVQAAQDELLKYKTLLDNFNRGLTKDGTLVGEYTSGILKAFKDSGLDDVISNQLKNAKKNVTDLDQEFEKLKEELRLIQQTGQGSLQAVEQQLIENRTAAAGFTDQINRVEAELRNMNSTGANIAGSIGLQFKNLKNDIAGFVLGFVGFQAALGGIQSFTSGAIEEFEQAETAVARFQSRLAITGRSDELEPINETIGQLVDKFKSLDNDDLTNAAESLVTYGKVGKEQIQELLPIIVDFAANQRISIQESGDAIIKALEGNGKALKVYGIDMKDAKNQAEAYGLVTDILGQKVKGSAEVFANTASGAMAAQKQELKDQQEILGERLLPTYITFTRVLATFASVMLGIPFGAWAAGLTLVAGAFTYLAIQNAFATKTGVLYQALMKGQIIGNYLAAAATKAYGFATRMATIEVRLFNTAIKVSPLGWLLTIVGLLLPALIGLASAFGANAKAMNSMVVARKDLNDAMAKGLENAADEITALDKSYKKTQDVKLSLKERTEEVVKLQKQFPSYFGNLTKEAILNGEAEKSYLSLRDAILASSRARAIEDKLKERAKDRLSEEERLIKKQREAEEEIRRNGGKEIRVVTPSEQGKGGRVDIISPAEADDIRKKRKAIADKELQDRRDFWRQEDDILAGALEEQKTVSAKYDADKEKQRQDALNKLNQYQGKEKAAKEKHVKEINRVDDLKKLYEQERDDLNAAFEDKTISERDYLESIIKLTTEYREKKLKAIINLNANELKSQKDFNAALAKEKADALQKEFEADVKAIDKIKKAQEDKVKAALDANEGNLSIDDVQRVDNKIKLDKQLLDIQVEYNNAIDLLEKKYALKSAENEEDRQARLKELQKALADDMKERQRKLFDQLLEDEKQEMRNLEELSRDAALKVLGDDKLSPAQKDKKLKAIEKKGAAGKDATRLFQIDDELDANRALLDQKLIAQKDYNEKVNDLENERLEILKRANDSELANEQLKNELKGQMQDAAFQITTDFLNKYIEGLQMDVEANHQAMLDKLAIEKEQRLMKSQSRAEDESIEKEFAAKEKEAERTRNKERQYVAKQQLALEFAVASMKALSTSSNIYEGLIKEAIVAAEYFASLALLNKQQFYSGGKVLPNGKIKEQGNITPTANGDNVLAYVRTGEVILNQQQQAALGGDSTFRKLGVPGFGSSVQPPVFRSYTQGGGSDIEEMKRLFYGLVEVVGHEASKPVVLNPHAVGNALNEQAKNIDLATI